MIRPKLKTKLDNNEITVSFPEIFIDGFRVNGAKLGPERIKKFGGVERSVTLFYYGDEEISHVFSSSRAIQTTLKDGWIFPDNKVFPSDVETMNASQLVDIVGIRDMKPNTELWDVTIGRIMDEKRKEHITKQLTTRLERVIERYEISETKIKKDLIGKDLNIKAREYLDLYVKGDYLPSILITFISDYIFYSSERLEAKNRKESINGSAAKAWMSRY
jgi:hypothetical protein